MRAFAVGISMAQQDAVWTFCKSHQDVLDKLNEHVEHHYRFYKTDEHDYEVPSIYQYFDSISADTYEVITLSGVPEDRNQEIQTLRREIEQLHQELVIARSEY